MAADPRPQILTINTGSSSLKAGLYDADSNETLNLNATVERIGQTGARLGVYGVGGVLLADEELELPDHGAAMRALLGWLARGGTDRSVAAIGHRVVHGGRAFGEPVAITDAVVAELRRLVPLAPNHLPQALDAIAVATNAFPGLPQVACFDTAFHRTLPRVARLYPLPRRFEAEGVVRYGFHGLSYESVISQLATVDPAAVSGRLVIAHLGNGASMVALRGGISVETTMGFTPSGGLMMGTRTGDLDPGVLLFLQREHGLGPSALGDLVNHDGGLRGVSGGSGDMRDLLARETSDPRAAEAVALFCYLAKKAIGGLAAVLGGLDGLVFTGGIGEHAAPVRERICADLRFLGVRLDPARNRVDEAVISEEGGPTVVRIVRTDEDRMIARHTARLLREEGASDVPL
ncbi:MAG TPA: acetate/propionate family kinase [Thermomicrobiales bacterium]|jgi:acetate kinase